MSIQGIGQKLSIKLFFFHYNQRYFFVRINLMKPIEFSCFQFKREPQIDGTFSLAIDQKKQKPAKPLLSRISSKLK